MRKIIIISVLLLQANIAYSEWHILEIRGQNIMFSEFTKSRKITVFIISTAGCPPCELLKENLKNDNSLKEVDFYEVRLDEGIKPTDLQDFPAYNIWRGTEQLSSFPYVYIFSPLTNLVSRGNFKAGEVKTNITKLIEAFRGYKFDEMLATRNSIEKKKENTQPSTPMREVEQPNENPTFPIMSSPIIIVDEKQKPTNEPILFATKLEGNTLVFSAYDIQGKDIDVIEKEDKIIIKPKQAYIKFDSRKPSQIMSVDDKRCFVINSFSNNIEIILPKNVKFRTPTEDKEGMVVIKVTEQTNQ